MKDILEIRKYLHQHPEIGFDTFNTANYIYDIFSKKTAEDIFKGEVDIEMLKKEVKEYLIDIIKSDEENKIKNKNIKDLTKKEIKFEFDIREE